MIFVDLDGVLADFETHFLNKMGYDIRNVSKTLRNSIWKELAEYHQDFYKDVPVMPDAGALIQYLNTLNPYKTILTAIPRRESFPLAESHKYNWFYGNFPECKHWDFSVGPYSIDKQNHAEYDYDILIDDKPKNIGQWINKGGIGILHKDAKSTIEILEELYD